MVRTYDELVALYGSSGSKFPDNSTRLIIEATMRQFGQDLADSLMFANIGDGVYLARIIPIAGTNTYTGTPSYALGTGYLDKAFYIKIANAPTGASTLNLGGVGPKKMFTDPTTQVGSGDLTAGQTYIAVYDPALDSAVGGFMVIGLSSGGGGVVDHWKGNYDASTDTLPATGIPGDQWVISVAGNLEDAYGDLIPVNPGDLIFRIAAGTGGDKFRIIQ